jgi:hypothetical protein
MPTVPDKSVTAAAVEARLQYAAERAVNDPVKVDRAARIIRLAIAQRRITIGELIPVSPNGRGAA